METWKLYFSFSIFNFHPWTKYFFQVSISQPEAEAEENERMKNEYPSEQTFLFFEYGYYATMENTSREAQPG